MVLFFFYDKFINIELLNKINDNFDMADGYIIIQNYDSDNNILEISDEPVNNNKILYGKIVSFDAKLDFVVSKMNHIEEFKFKNDSRDAKYKLDAVWVNKKLGGVYKAFIIY